MPAGRKPTPTRLKVLAGTDRPDRINPNEPEPERGIPKIPAHVKGRSRDAWKELAPLLDRMGVLTMPDGKALELLCDAYSDYRDACEVIRMAGTTYSTTTQQGDTMYRPRPEVAMRDGAWKRVMDGLRDFGCTPSSRSKVSTVEDQQDDAARFFGTG